MQLSIDRLHRCAFDPSLSAISFLNEVTEHFPDAISFAAGRPDVSAVDTEVAFDLIGRYADHLSSSVQSAERVRDILFQYGPAAGHIQDLIAHALRVDEEIEADPAAIVVTLGAQEAIALTMRALVATDHDVLIVPRPCYAGVIGAASVLGIGVVGVDEGTDGLTPDAVESAVLAELADGRRPRAVYVTPDHSNPSGKTLPFSARTGLLAVAERHDLVLIEDSPYRLVTPASEGRFADRLPTLKSLDTDQRVVHIGSFSKTLFPGVRVGFAVADQPTVAADGSLGTLADTLSRMKSLLSLNTPTLSQAVAAGALLECGGRMSQRTAPMARRYGHALLTLLDELDSQFDATTRSVARVEWNRPSGGFFVVASVPFPADERALTVSACDFGVLWTPMRYFYIGPGGERQIRLSASSLSTAEIREGVARFVRFVRSQVEDHPLRPADRNEVAEHSKVTTPHQKTDAEEYAR